MQWGNPRTVFLSSVIIALCFIYTGQGLTLAGGQPVVQSDNIEIWTPEEKNLIGAARTRILQTKELLEALYNLSDATTRANINLRKRQVGASSEETDDDRTTVTESASKVDQILRSILEEEKKLKASFKGDNETAEKQSLFISEADLDPLSEDELIQLERMLEGIIKERNVTTTTVPPPPTGQKVNSTPTTKKPSRLGVLGLLSNLRGYVTRRNILGVLKGTRTAVEFLENIGVVDELSTPILVGDTILTGLENLAG